MQPIQLFHIMLAPCHWSGQNQIKVDAKKQKKRSSSCWLQMARPLGVASCSVFTLKSRFPWGSPHLDHSQSSEVFFSSHFCKKKRHYADRAKVFISPSSKWSSFNRQSIVRSGLFSNVHILVHY